MSATDGPMVPSISGRLLDLLEPSSETVIDRFAVPLMCASLLPGAYRREIMAGRPGTQPSRPQQRSKEGFTQRAPRTTEGPSRQKKCASREAPFCLSQCFSVVLGALRVNPSLL